MSLAINSVSSPPIFTPTSRARKDTTAAFESLLAAFGGSTDRRNEYIKKMRSFLLGRITRTELESFISKDLTPKHVRLHNTLILAILYNVQKAVAKPAGFESRRLTANSQQTHGAGGRRRIRKLERSDMCIKILSSLTTQDKTRIMGLMKDTKHLIRAPEFVDRAPPLPLPVPLPPFTPASAASMGVDDLPAGLESIPLRCTESRDLPSMELLSQKVRFLSKLEGLETPTPEVVEILSDALGDRLRSILHEAAALKNAGQASFTALISISRQQGNVFNSPSRSGSLDPSGMDVDREVPGLNHSNKSSSTSPPRKIMDNSSLPSLLNLEDLQCVVELSPHFFTSNPSFMVARENLSP